MSRWTETHKRTRPERRTGSLRRFVDGASRTAVIANCLDSSAGSYIVNLLFANAAVPEPETIRRTAQEVAGRPEFRVHPVRDNAVIWERLWKILRPIFRFFAQLWD